MSERKPKLTPWFRRNVKPLRVGYYERDWSDTYSDPSASNNDYWDGKNWLLDSKDGAVSLTKRRWRGLAADPKAKP